MTTRQDMPGCHRRPPLVRRLRAAVRRLRRSSPRRCEVRPDWMDEGPASSVREPRRPRPPHRGGAVALELPPAAPSEG